MDKAKRPRIENPGVTSKRESITSRIPGFYRLSIEQRLAYLASNFDLDDKQVHQLRDGKALRIEHAVNMVENAIGVLGMPLGLGLNFLVDSKEFIVPMAIEEASIIAAVSKGALLIREGGGFNVDVDSPLMIGQIQVLDLENVQKAKQDILDKKKTIIDRANLANVRMIARGGGVKDVEVRVVDGGESVGLMLIVHLIMDVREAMGANAINYACEAAGPIIEEITGGRVNLRILSNYADKRIARANFKLPFKHISTKDLSGIEVAKRMVEADSMAWADPYRATTHNKGIFNGICAAALALGQDWRAIEAGGHAYAARDGVYRSLTKFWIEEENLCGSIELPLQVGWVGGAVNSHPGVITLRKISGVRDSQELAGLLASVGLAQNFAACLALSTVGIQKGHMALHARSVAISVGVPPELVDDVAHEMILRGEVKVAVAEEVYRDMQSHKKLETIHDEGSIILESFAPGKVVLFGEHATVYNFPGITASIDVGLRLKITPDSDGPRFIHPKFLDVFNIPENEQDLQLFSKAVDKALNTYKLQNEEIAIRIDSDLVPGMGLGSSAAFSTALCKGLRKYKNLEIPQHWDSELFTEVQELESIFHGHPSGMDAATVLSHGVLWFRKGPPREILPIRLPHPMYGVTCLVEQGARTIELVRKVSEFREADPEVVDAILEEIGNITVDAGIALGMGDVREVGRLMLKNHEQLVKLGVSTPALNSAIEKLIDMGALGAKLTGSGGGGAVIAIVENEEAQEEMLRNLDGQFPMVFPFVIGDGI